MEKIHCQVKSLQVCWETLNKVIPISAVEPQQTEKFHRCLLNKFLKLIVERSSAAEHEVNRSKPEPNSYWNHFILIVLYALSNQLDNFQRLV